MWSEKEILKKDWIDGPFSKMLPTLKDIIVDVNNIPGIFSFYGEDFSAKKFNPRSNSDRITVENFYQGLCALEKDYLNQVDEKKKGIDGGYSFHKLSHHPSDLHRDNFLAIHVGHGVRSYHLDFLIDSPNKLTYRAFFHKTTPHFFDIMERHGGPNVFEDEKGAF